MAENNQLQRGLKERHVQMIAIGGAIGVGLFLGSAQTINMAGPGILVTYGIAGIIIFFIMRALGEMAVEFPVAGAFSAYANDFVGPFHGFLVGCMYWVEWTVIAMAELTAMAIYVNFWFPDFPQWASTLIFLGLLTLANLTAASLFGEMEFWFAIIKVVTILAMILIGACMILFGLGNGGEAIGFSNLTSHGGFFPNGARGVFDALVMVAFAFIGVELIGITAGEAENPRKVIPKAINTVIYRILIFYIGALFVIMCLYPWDEIGTTGSPFVLTFSKLGIAAAAGIINFVVLTAALSSCNSGLYSCGRMLYNLSVHNQAPKMFGKISKHHVPANAIVFTSALVLIGVIINYVMPDKAFTYLTSVSSFCAIYAWGMITLTQMKFRKGLSEGQKKNLAFKMPFYPFSNILTLIVLVVILAAMAAHESTRIAIPVGLAFMIVFTAAYYIFGLNKQPAEKRLHEISHD
ncbi:amino acid permease [Peptococcus simiae]|uniref:amino acid permease n=1 Tax=Peptococcus simiae TaxID=1643805 RepID=UPI00397EBE94